MSLSTYDKGMRIQGPIVALAAAGVAAAAVIFTQSVFAQLVGTKSLVIKKVILMNNLAGNTTVLIGTGVGGAFVAAYPAFNSLNGLRGEWDEPELPRTEFFANITAYPVALAAGTTIDIQIEVEEIG